MLDNLSGATRVYIIVGDPIAQVRSPAGMTRAFEACGMNAVCVPAWVAPADLGSYLDALRQMRNLDGVLVTVPHKFAAAEACTQLSARARFLETVNVMRRLPDGGWLGDALDGLGYVAALRALGQDLQGLRVLITGAGGAGTCIAHALLQASVGELAVHDPDIGRRDRLLERLGTIGASTSRAGSDDAGGFDIVINASPCGMRPEDPLPVRTESLDARTIVGDVITDPLRTPLLERARALGCPTVDGADMYGQVAALMVEFFQGNEL
ncbi:MAG: shikimate dehydrogenase [Gammaproteobacteria bacterium]|nr:shikimate dehydrogenase [Gammaproteobacteria bacterium]